MTVDKGPLPYPLEDRTFDEPLKLRPIRMVAHPIDPEALDVHVAGFSFMAHTHSIFEDWPVEKKKRIASHVDRWHFRVS